MNIISSKKHFLFLSQPDFACNPHALWSYVTQNTEHEASWLVRKAESLYLLRECGIRCELYDTENGNDLLAKADYVICNTYYPLLKRDGQVFVNLWHGSGIKAHDFFSGNMSSSQIRKLQNFAKDTDLLCLHSLDDRFRLCAMLGFDIGKSIATGQPHLDCLKTSNGKDNLRKIFGNILDKYTNLIFFAPSFRANSSSRVGNFLSDNIFRLNDFDDDMLFEFLSANNAALIYKLHPIEQNTFQGIKNRLNRLCFELTDKMLFDNDIRYDEILNAFDVLITDYSSIAFDWLLLDRPIVYLTPDYDDYIVNQGFVFNNIDDYMPGSKVKASCALIEALNESFEQPQKYQKERQMVIRHRFDFCDCKSAKRVYKAIMEYKPVIREVVQHQTPILPTPTTFLKKYFNDSLVIDASRDTLSDELIKQCNMANRVVYITEEIPNESRSVNLRADCDMLDLQLFRFIQTLKNVEILHIKGGVEYSHFKSRKNAELNNIRPVIGFAGAVDCRIWFAAIQAISDEFPNYEIRFAGDIIGERPGWIDNLPNVNYVGQITYEQLPNVISEFDVAILPMYDKYRERVPVELFWYLACGKVVVTAQMPNLPKCEAILQAKTVVDFASQIKNALGIAQKEVVINSATEIAKKYDWKGR